MIFTMFVGKYYLENACFMLKGQILNPYRVVRYHLKEYSRRGPKCSRVVQSSLFIVAKCN